LYCSSNNGAGEVCQVLKLLGIKAWSEVVGVAGVEPPTPNSLQLYDIIGYN